MFTIDKKLKTTPPQFEVGDVLKSTNSAVSPDQLYIYMGKHTEYGYHTLLMFPPWPRLQVALSETGSSLYKVGHVNSWPTIEVQLD